ncbi:ABC transporter substrate-binding protein [Microbacterium sp. NPDC097977]|uniref:ABC transporter substrate-binding protein n=1 Tax=Microbacterium sp. NPDC097977 TaxID=3155686 RepID=UPI00331D8E75
MTHDHRRRPSRLLSTAVVATAAALVLSACGPAEGPSGDASTGGEPQTGGTLTVALSATPAIIDPFATSLQADWVIARQVCEPLFDVSTTYEVGPVLADEITDEGDGLYNIVLREGVTFQNDEPFTSKDVIASLNRYFETPGNGSILASLTESVEAVDDTTVAIRLNTPSPLLPTLLTTAYMMPASVVEGRPASDAVDELVCTGPYTVSSYAADGDVVLDRWDGYQKRSEAPDGGLGAKEAYADQIVFTPMPEASTRRQATESGQIDIGGVIPLDDYDSVVSGGQAQAILLSPTSGSTVVFNKAQGIMSDVKMREAFLAALNMDDIMLAAFGNPEFFTVDGSFIPATNEFWATDAGAEAYNAQDVDRVKDLLDEAGYDGEPIVWLTTKEDPSWYGPALPAQQQLKEAGINIDLRVLDRATVIQQRTDPAAFDLFSSGIPTYADPVLLPYLQQTFPGSWASTERDELLTALSTESDADARKSTWEEMQTLVYADLPFLKFGTSRPLVIASNRTYADRPDELASLYFNVWVDQK